MYVSKEGDGKHNLTRVIVTLTPVSGALASDPFHHRKQGHSPKGGRV